MYLYCVIILFVNENDRSKIYYTLAHYKFIDFFLAVLKYSNRELKIDHIETSE